MNNPSRKASERSLILSQGQNIPINNVHGDLQSLDLNLVDLSGKRISPIIHLGNDNQIEFGLTGIEAGTYFFYGHVNGFKIERQVVVVELD